MTISMLGIDIAKSTFQLHGADNTGMAILKKRLPRHKLAAYVANMPPCTIAMESCGGDKLTKTSFGDVCYLRLKI